MEKKFPSNDADKNKLRDNHVNKDLTFVRQRFISRRTSRLIHRRHHKKRRYFAEWNAVGSKKDRGSINSESDKHQSSLRRTSIAEGGTPVQGGDPKYDRGNGQVHGHKKERARKKGKKERADITEAKARSTVLLLFCKRPHHQRPSPPLRKRGKLRQ